MNFIGFQHWYKELNNIEHLIIAGPCAAESRNQLVNTAIAIKKNSQINVFRAGVWKPRTNPNTFSGVGEIAFEWLREVKSITNFLICIEVATAEHIEKCKKNKDVVDILWIGARTVTNPFSMQALADALKNCDIPVMIKNPITPDLKLWIGAIERVYNSGITKIAAIHRGFHPFESTTLRNVPKWDLVIDLKTQLPNLQIINDPSHIAGDSKYIYEIASKALCLNFDGLMIETHENPTQALSDAKQQLTPNQLDILLKELIFRKSDSEANYINSDLERYRFQIDSIDYQLLDLLAKRMNIIEKIADLKNQNNLSIFQLDRWKKIINSRVEVGERLNLDTDFVKNLIQLIHSESILLQTKKINKE